MKAVRMYNPGDLRIEDVEKPSPKADEVLIQIMAVGVCGSDIPRINVYGAYISPITPGHEFAGKVVEVGSDVKAFKVGDKVTVPPLIPCNNCEWCEKGVYSLCESYDYFGSRRDGAMAEYVAVSESSLLKVPDTVSYIDAATTDPAANAMHGLAQAQMKKGDFVCAYGAGPIGLYAIQAAKAMGASKVFAVDLGEEKIKIAKACGADVVIDAKTQDPVAIIEKETNGKMCDVVIDFTGAPPAQKKCIEVAGKMSRIVLVGISHAGLDLSEKEVDKLMRGQISLIGSWNSFTDPFPGDDWFTALKMFESGEIKAGPMLSHKLSLDDAPDIFKKIAVGGLFFNKIMFLPFGENYGE